MYDLLDVIKSHVTKMLQERGVPQWAVVTSVDPNTARAKVQFHGATAPSGWLQVAVQSVGNGWGMLCMPAIGQQVFVVPDCGDSEHGVIVGSGFSTQNPPPSVPSAPGGASTPCQPGEALMVHQDGAIIRLTANGIYSKGAWIHDGNFTAQTGDIADKHGTLDRLRGHYNGHTHSGVQTGSGNTGTTSESDPE